MFRATPTSLHKQSAAGAVRVFVTERGVPNGSTNELDGDVSGGSGACLGRLDV